MKGVNIAHLHKILQCENRDRSGAGTIAHVFTSS